MARHSESLKSGSRYTSKDDIPDSSSDDQQEIESGSQHRQGEESEAPESDDEERESLQSSGFSTGDRSSESKYSGSLSIESQQDGPGAQLLDEQFRSSGIVGSARTQEAAERPNQVISSKKRKLTSLGNLKAEGYGLNTSEIEDGNPLNVKSPVRPKRSRRSPSVANENTSVRQTRSRTTQKPILNGKKAIDASISTSQMDGKGSDNLIGLKPSRPVTRQQKQRDSSTRNLSNKSIEHSKGSEDNSRRKARGVAQTEDEDDEDDDDYKSDAEEDEQEGEEEEENEEEKTGKKPKTKERKAEDERKLKKAGDARHHDQSSTISDKKEPYDPTKKRGMFRRSIDCPVSIDILDKAVKLSLAVEQKYYKECENSSDLEWSPEKSAMEYDLLDEIKATISAFIRQFDITNGDIDPERRAAIFSIGHWEAIEKRVDGIRDLAHKVQSQVIHAEINDTQDQARQASYVYGQICTRYIGLISTFVHYYGTNTGLDLDSRDRNLTEETFLLVQRHSRMLYDLLATCGSKNYRVGKKVLKIRDLEMEAAIESLESEVFQRLKRFEKRRQRIAAIADQEAKVNKARVLRQEASDNSEQSFPGPHDHQESIPAQSRPLAQHRTQADTSSESSTATNQPERIEEWSKVEIENLIKGLIVTKRLHKKERMKKLHSQYCSQRDYVDVVDQVYLTAKAIHAGYSNGDFGGDDNVPFYASSLVDR